VIDQARPVRKGEELDAARLGAFLADRLGVERELRIEQFPAGHSNLTYLVTAGGRELVLRRPPFGSKVKSAHDMGREYKILSRLWQVYPPAPRALLACDDLDVIGAPFYVMERVRGVILRKEPPRDLTIDARHLSEAMVDNLAAIHAVDVAAAGLADLGKPEGYVERQVSGWTKRYVDSRTDDIPDVERAARWLAERIPKETGSGGALIHNDYKYDNVVLDERDPTKIVGVLDWEMSTIGDPLMDLGTFLNYWVDPGDDEDLRALRFGPTDAPGSLARPALAARYAERTGRDVSNVVFYYTFACFKTAVVLQQIYLRWVKGLTRDERFGALIDGVRTFARTAVKAIERGTL
jgi:aminoglycoside phosphotransferase (APT) family kinase protein